MKNNRSLINGLIAGVMALAMASTLTAQTVTQVKARVVRIKGYARFTTGNNVWQNLKVGEMLRAGKRPPKEFSRPEVAQILIEAMAERTR